MRTLKNMLLLMVVVALLRCCSAADSSDVVILTDANIDQQLTQGTWLVEFYAPWCGHCKNLAPIWETVATSLKGTINVAKLDCTQERNSASRFAIAGFPTIKLIKDGKIYDYSGARTLEAFTAFSSTGYATAAVKDIPPPKQPAAAPTPAAAAPAAEKVAEDPTPAAENPTPAAAERAAPPAPADNKAPPANAAPSADAQTGSDVVVLTQENFDTLTAEGDWLLEFYAPWCGHCKMLAPVYEELATKLKGKVNVGKIDCTVEKSFTTRFEVKGFPTIKFYKHKLLFNFKGARTVESFLDFVDQGYLAASPGAMMPSDVAPPPTPAAAAAPASNNKKDTRADASASSAAAGLSDVIVLTDANFEEKTTLGDWLVMFYAPWCGHCQRLKPIFEQVATALKGTVNIAKVDCTVERGVCEQHEIAGYPTVTYFHNGKMYQYSGDRSLEAFKQFVKSGWESITPENLPAPRSLIKETLIRAVQQIETQFSNNIYYIFGACIGVGVLLGLVIVLLAPKPRADKPKHE